MLQSTEATDYGRLEAYSMLFLGELRPLRTLPWNIHIKRDWWRRLSCRLIVGSKTFDPQAVMFELQLNAIVGLFRHFLLLIPLARRCHRIQLWYA